jgi:hypothetical protein
MNIKDLYQKRDHFFIKISPTARGGLIFCILLGITSFAAGMLSGEHTRTWGSFLFNAMFFFSIALGGTAFGNMQDVISAKWGRPIKRIHESFSAFLPLVSVLFIAFLVCVKFDVLQAGKVYKWIADPSIVAHFFGKNVWLQPNFMFVRDIFALVVIVYLTQWHYRVSTAADRAFLSNHFEEGVRLGQKAQKTLGKWSAPVLIVYSILYSILAFDLLMSLTPTWVSTLWAGWQFSVMMQTLLATTLLVLFYLKKKPVGHYIGRQQFHDVGKLLFGFTAFYAYLTYAHVLTYWYTNMPEETSYFITRLQNPWFCYIIAAPFVSFLIPFILMVPKASKWTGFVAIPVCLLVLASQWINMMLVVSPEVSDAKLWSLSWIELGMLLGFLSAFILTLVHRSSKIPVINLADPLLYQSSGH